MARRVFFIHYSTLTYSWLTSLKTLESKLPIPSNRLTVDFYLNPTESRLHLSVVIEYLRYIYYLSLLIFIYVSLATRVGVLDMRAYITYTLPNQSVSKDYFLFWHCIFKAVAGQYYGS